MPLWEPYDEMLASDVADIGNMSDAPMAGAVTAALFLQQVRARRARPGRISTPSPGAPAAKPGRPKGGDALGPARGLGDARTRATAR